MEGKSDPFGRDAIRPLDIPVRGWWQVAERVLSESSRDNLSVVAAGCAFYALFAIFPVLSALISLYGLVADPANIEQSFDYRADQARGPSLGPDPWVEYLLKSGVGPLERQFPGTGIVRRSQYCLRGA